MECHPGGRGRAIGRANVRPTEGWTFGAAEAFLGGIGKQDGHAPADGRIWVGSCGETMMSLGFG